MAKQKRKNKPKQVSSANIQSTRKEKQELREEMESKLEQVEGGKSITNSELELEIMSADAKPDVDSGLESIIQDKSDMVMCRLGYENEQKISKGIDIDMVLDQVAKDKSDRESTLEFDKEQIESQSEQIESDTNTESNLETVNGTGEDKLKVKAQELDFEAVETKLEASTKTNQELEEKYNQKIKMRISQTEELEKTKSQLEKEQLRSKETLSVLSMATERNRLLENKYELEKNAGSCNAVKLRETQLALENSHKSLADASDILDQVKCDLRYAQYELCSKSYSLDKLEEERKSLQKMGRLILQLSKSRIQERLENVSERFIRSKNADVVDSIEYEKRRSASWWEWSNGSASPQSQPIAKSGLTAWILESLKTTVHKVRRPISHPINVYMDKFQDVVANGYGRTSSTKSFV